MIIKNHLYSVHYIPRGFPPQLKSFEFLYISFIGCISYPPQKRVVITARISGWYAFLVIRHRFAPVVINRISSSVLNPENVVVAFASCGCKIARLQTCLRQDNISAGDALLAQFVSYLGDGLGIATYCWYQQNDNHKDFLCHCLPSFNALTQVSRNWLQNSNSFQISL